MEFFRQALFFFLLFPLIVFSCTSTPLPQSDPVIIPEDFLGIVHAGNSGEFKLLNEMGVNWLLNTFYWRRIEKEKGCFDFSVYDEFVDSAKREGKKIIAVLGYDSPWLLPKGKKYILPENIPFFLNYVEETVRHFKGRIDVWEIWNEPNFYKFWQGSRKEFFELSRLTALKIKETDPGSYVIGGVFWRSPSGFIKNMHKTGAMENMDGLAFHPYAVNPSGAMKLHDKFLKTLSEIEFSGPVWITEIGYPTGGFFPSRVSMEKLPSFVIKTISGAAARGTRVLLWYELTDSYNIGETSRNTKSSENFFGLIYPNYQRKNGSWAYELCAAFLPGSRYESAYPIRENIPRNIISLCFMEGISGNNVLILWNDNKQIKKAYFYLVSPAFLYDISTGIKIRLQTGTTLEIGTTPLFITWQGNSIPKLVSSK